MPGHAFRYKHRILQHPSPAARNLRLLYAFQALRSLELFGAISVPFYLEWGGLDYTRMFVLEGAFALFMFVLEVPTGTIADRFGRKWSLVAGALFSGAAFMMFGLVRSYPGLAADHSLSAAFAGLGAVSLLFAFRLRAVAPGQPAVASDA